MRQLLLLAALALQALHAQPPEFFFIQLSDTQYGMHTKDHDFVQDQANFEFVVATVNRLKPKFVVICGDLINKPGDAAQAGAFLATAKKIDSSIPLYLVPGNHDVENSPTPESLERYRKRFGRDYYSFDSGPIRGIVLNSSLIASPQTAQTEAERQEKWLRSELERAQTEKVKHIVVFQHHPFFVKEANEEDGYFNIRTGVRRSYLDLFHRYGVRYIFAGHLHRTSYGEDGNLRMITTGPVGMPLAGAKSGIRLVLLDGGELIHRYYELGELPIKVNIAEIRQNPPASASGK